MDPQKLFNSMPEDGVEKDEVLEAVIDSFDNGGKVPENPSLRFLAIGLRRTYRRVSEHAVASKRNQRHLWILTAVFTLVFGALVVLRQYDLMLINQVHEQAGLPQVIFFNPW